MPLSSSLRSARVLRGLSQLALAERAGITRQSIHAMESGRRVPGVDVALRLAGALETTVEALFAENARTETLVAKPALREKADVNRVALARTRKGWFSYALDRETSIAAADGLALAYGRVEPLRSERELAANLVVMGCAPALGILADHVARQPGLGRLHWAKTSSTRALEALADGTTHLAGIHLVDRRTGIANIGAVKRFAGREHATLVTVARWQVGFVTRPSDHPRFAGARDLRRARLRVAAREGGAGARRVLDDVLGTQGLVLADVAHEIYEGHLEVARSVLSGASDVGVATQDAALAFGLRFLPLTEERYDLAIPKALGGDPRVARVMDALTSRAFSRDLDALGYDVRECGNRLSSKRAA